MSRVVVLSDEQWREVQGRLNPDTEIAIEVQCQLQGCPLELGEALKLSGELTVHGSDNETMSDVVHAAALAIGRLRMKAARARILERKG